MWRDRRMSEQAQNEYIASLNGELTAEQAAQLLEMIGNEGDTGTTTPDTSTQPGVDTDTQTTSDDGEQPAAETQQANTGEPDPAGAVILARDGKHTIPYEKLAASRAAEQHWRGVAQEAERKLAELQANASARAEAGEAPTKADNQLAAAQAAMDAGADPAIFGDFSEEDLAKGINTLIDQRVAASVAKALEPLRQKDAVDATAAHYRAIYDKHPDADSIAESKELADWIASKPSFMRPSLESVLDAGTSAQVIEFFDTFKQESGMTRSTAAPEAGQGDALRSAREAANKAIQSAAPKVPASLSDFPGGRAAGLTREEQLAQLNGMELLDAMQSGNMTPEQIERFLNNL